MLPYVPHSSRNVYSPQSLHQFFHSPKPSVLPHFSPEHHSTYHISHPHHLSLLDLHMSSEVYRSPVVIGLHPAYAIVIFPTLTDTQHVGHTQSQHSASPLQFLASDSARHSLHLNLPQATM